jgi:hypothetical protein
MLLHMPTITECKRVEQRECVCRQARSRSFRGRLHGAEAPSEAAAAGAQAEGGSIWHGLAAGCGRGR